MIVVYIVNNLVQYLEYQTNKKKNIPFALVSIIKKLILIN